MSHPSDRWLFATLGATTVMTSALWAWFLSVPHQVERVEVHVRALVEWWRSGIVPYGAGDSLPLLQNPYGPVYSYFLAIMPDGPSPYFAGRLLTLVAVTASLFIVALWVRRRTGVVAAAILAAMLPLSVKPWLLFGPLYRVDSMAIAASVLGFALVTQIRGRAGALLGALAFGLALSIKLTAVAAPAACILWLYTKDRQRGLELTALVTFVALSSIGFMEWWTGGNYLASAALGNLPRRIDKSFDLLLRNGLWLGWWLAVGIAVRHRPRSWASPAACYLLTSLATAMAFGANPLSSWNYLLEPVLALALWTGELLGLTTPEVYQRMSRYLTIHAACALPLIALWSFDAIRQASEYRPVFEDARACVAASVADRSTLARSAEARVAAVDSLAIQDSLNSLGIPSWTAGTHSVLNRPPVHQALRQALGENRLDVVYGDIGHPVQSPADCTSSSSSCLPCSNAPRVGQLTKP